jgi:hypothetical protein
MDSKGEIIRLPKYQKEAVDEKPTDEKLPIPEGFVEKQKEIFNDDFNNQSAVEEKQGKKNKKNKDNKEDNTFDEKVDSNPSQLPPQQPQQPKAPVNPTNTKYLADQIINNPVIDNVIDVENQDYYKANKYWQDTQLQCPFLKDIYPHDSIIGKPYAQVEIEIRQVLAMRTTDALIMTGFRTTNSFVESMMCSKGIDISGYSDLVCLNPEIKELLMIIRLKHQDKLVEISPEMKLGLSCAMTAVLCFNLNRSKPKQNIPTITDKPTQQPTQQPQDLKNQIKNSFMNTFAKKENKDEKDSVFVPITKKDDEKIDPTKSAAINLPKPTADGTINMPMAFSLK